jgi:hypothetical protein
LPFELRWHITIIIFIAGRRVGPPGTGGRIPIIIILLIIILLIIDDTIIIIFIVGRRVGLLGRGDRTPIIIIIIPGDDGAVTGVGAGATGAGAVMVGEEAGAEAGATVVGAVPPPAGLGAVGEHEMGSHSPAFRQSFAAMYSSRHDPQLGQAVSMEHVLASSWSQEVTCSDPSKHATHSSALPAPRTHVANAAFSSSQGSDEDGAAAGAEGVPPTELGAATGAVGAVGTELHPAKQPWGSL